jgi:hypothetical protein
MIILDLTNLDGDTVYVNMSNIVSFKYRDDTAGSILVDVSGELHNVREAPYDICKLLRNIKEVKLIP